MAETEPDPVHPEPSLLNGYPTGQTPPEPLPGRTAQQLQITSAWFQLAAVAVAAPVFFESAFQQYQPWYAIGFLSGTFVLLALSVVCIARGHGRIKGELSLGYTTIPSVARRVPGVFYFHPVTKTVIAVPGAPRPARVPDAPKGLRLL